MINDREPPLPPPLPPLPAWPPAPVTARGSFWRRPIGIVVAILLALGSLGMIALVGIGIGGMTGHLPSTKALQGTRLPDRVARILTGAGILEPDEQILWFYSAGVLDYLEDGNLLTDRRAVSYFRESGEIEVSAARYEDIADVTVAWSDSWLVDTVITVKCADESEFSLVVSRESGGDRKFHAELEQQRKRRR